MGRPLPILSTSSSILAANAIILQRPRHVAASTLHGVVARFTLGPDMAARPAGTARGLFAGHDRSGRRCTAATCRAARPVPRVLRSRRRHRPALLHVTMRQRDSSSSHSAERSISRRATASALLSAPAGWCSGVCAASLSASFACEDFVKCGTLTPAPLYDPQAHSRRSDRRPDT
jgi:hypothetical protein